MCTSRPLPKPSAVAKSEPRFLAQNNVAEYWSWRFCVLFMCFSCFLLHVHVCVCVVGHINAGYTGFFWFRFLAMDDFGWTISIRSARSGFLLLKFLQNPTGGFRLFFCIYGCFQK